MTTELKDRAEEIRAWLKAFPTNPSAAYVSAVERAFLFIWARQTADEQEDKNTNHSNGRGFNKFDAMRAGWANDALNQYGGFSVKRACSVAKMLVKYSGQLAEMPKPETAQVA